MSERPARVRRGQGWTCRWLSVALALLAIVAGSTLLPAQTDRPVVYVVPISGVIDLGLAPFVSRALDEASSAAAAVILAINTLGGRVDAAILIRDVLLQARVRTVAAAFREGSLGIMDYYHMKNVQADTSMREAIAGGESEPFASAPPERRR